ncbi:PEP-CTERM sorting domain-containing protein [Desulfogranum marinum]|uniref:PEP-CTERM sorting domain-containing protein n=1 Tax=Desulfogranum marinum TaxID=453220 RepID=UPI0029C6EEA5|nr:PEP-CTERM sorting domain-containing protein [Desulfogranum marinum]
MQTLKQVFIAVTLLSLLTINAYALPSSGDTVVLQNGDFGTTAGGEFDIFVNGSTTRNYISFCLERDENIRYGTEYVISSISNYAELGGLGGQDATGKDSIDVKTAWIYWNYLYGNLSAWGTEDALANLVQKSIWEIEGEGTFSSNDSFLDFVDNLGSWEIAGNVQAMNIVRYESDGETIKEYHQSQLIADPVPEPTTMLLFGTGIAALAGVSRRKMRK